MQKTRQQILDVLNHKKQATVQEIVDALQQMRGDKITAVTVRHHLTLLQKENLIVCPEIRHHNKPGRPQHVYALTDKAQSHLPENYKMLTSHLIEQISRTLPPEHINVMFEDMAETMAQSANIPQIPLPQRLELVVEYLNYNGYDATWKQVDEGYMLYTTNCPYHNIAQGNEMLCHMDTKLMASLVGIVPRCTSRISTGCAQCAYLFPTDNK